MKLFFDPNEPKPLHVIGKCPGGRWPIKKMSDAWKVFGEVIAEFSEGDRLRTHAFVMMRNHYHWLVSCHEPKADLDDLFWRFHDAVNFDVTFGFNAEHIHMFGVDPEQMFQDPPQIIELDHIEAYRQAYAYVYCNPVKAGIVEKPAHYPYSTLPYVLGRTSKKLKFPCIDNMNLIYHPTHLLNFIDGAQP